METIKRFGVKMGDLSKDAALKRSEVLGRADVAVVVRHVPSCGIGGDFYSSILRSVV